mgnify:CR=1 FL=1
MELLEREEWEYQEKVIEIWRVTIKKKQINERLLTKTTRPYKENKMARIINFRLLT